MHYILNMTQGLLACNLPQKQSGQLLGQAETPFYVYKRYFRLYKKNDTSLSAHIAYISRNGFPLR